MADGIPQPAGLASDGPLIDFLESLGLDPSHDMLAQLRVFAEALYIYEERERQRGSAWKGLGCDDKAHHIRSKAARINHIVASTLTASEEETHLTYSNGTDEALDIINYAGFYIRQARGEA